MRPANKMPGELYLNTLYELCNFPDEVIADVRSFFNELGVPVTEDQEKKSFTFLINTPTAQEFCIAFNKAISKTSPRVFGIYQGWSKEHKCGSFSIRSLDNNAFQKLDRTSFPKYRDFESKLGVTDITKHEAFIDDYSQLHSNALVRQATGTYAIRQDGNYFELLVANGYGGAAKYPKFTVNSDNSIEFGNIHYRSIHHLLHDNQYLIVSSLTHSIITVSKPLNAVFAENKTLTTALKRYVENQELPEVKALTGSLCELARSNSLRFEAKEFVRFGGLVINDINECRVGRWE